MTTYQSDFCIASDSRAIMTLAIIIVMLLTLLVLYISFSLYLKLSIRKCECKVSMKGKVVIVTGANAGIGFYTAKDLASRGARVILACRDPGRGTAAQDTIIEETGNHNVIYQHLDLSSFKSVRQFAANIIETENKLDVLVNNAGIYGFADTYTEDGIIQPMQVNFFGHFLLTQLLLSLLKKSQPSRIINLSSILHFFGRFNPNSINERGFLNNNTFVYSNSKFCMLVLSMELSRRLQGSGVVANAVHPGVIMTGITKYIPHVLRFLFWCWSLMYSRTAEDGAQTVIHLAVAEKCEKKSGKYYVDCSSRFMLWKATSKSKGKELWDYSAKQVGIEPV